MCGNRIYRAASVVANKCWYIQTWSSPQLKLYETWTLCVTLKLCKNSNLCLRVSSISMNPLASWWCHIFMASELFNAVKRSTNKIEKRDKGREFVFRNDYSSLFSCQLQKHSPRPHTSVISYLCLMADQSKLWGDNNSWKRELLSSLVHSLLMDFSSSITVTIQTISVCLLVCGCMHM